MIVVRALVILAVLVFAAPARADKPAGITRTLRAIGAAKTPLYIHPTEIRSTGKPRFNRGPGTVRARIGKTRSRPIELSGDKTYLWTIDQNGTLAIAPKLVTDIGSEKSGHVLITGSRPARLRPDRELLCHQTP